MKINGFSIIELMVTMAILAILASVAIPSYQNQALKGDRSDGLESIHAIMNAQERFYADNMSYADDLKDLGMASSTYTTPKGHYKISVEKCTGMEYTQCVQLKATAQDSQAKDGDLIFNTAGKQVRKVGTKEHDL